MRFTQVEASATGSLPAAGLSTFSGLCDSPCWGWWCHSCSGSRGCRRSTGHRQCQRQPPHGHPCHSRAVQAAAHTQSIASMNAGLLAAWCDPNIVLCIQAPKAGCRRTACETRLRRCWHNVQSPPKVELPSPSRYCSSPLDRVHVVTSLLHDAHELQHRDTGQALALETSMHSRCQ